MKTQMISAVIICTAVCINPTSLGRASDWTADEIADRVDACVATAMETHTTVGLAAAVVMHGEIAYERGYGVRHHSDGGAVDEHTLFRHGSTGKIFTAAAVLRLVDQGLVNLDDPVIEYIPELHFAGRWTADQMQVRHLINHSAAVPSFRSADDSTLEEWAGSLSGTTLFAKPGSFWAYSNSNFALAGLVVERASGMSFADYVEAEIYAPAGMEDATFDPAVAMATGNYSWGHVDDGTIYAPDAYDYPVERASGVSFSSAHDLALWARLMLAGGGEVLSVESAIEAQNPQMPMHYSWNGKQSIGGGAYGFGLFVDQYPDATITWHNGGVPGWVGHLSWIGSEGFAVALLANSWPDAFTALSEASECICEALLDITMPDMSEASEPGTWSAYEGTYDAVFEDGYAFEAEVEMDGDALWITLPDLANPSETITRELQNLHGSAFRFWQNAGSYWDVTFIPGEGHPAPVHWLRNQRFAGLRRVEERRAGGRFAP